MSRRALTFVVLSLLIVAGLFIYLRQGHRPAVATNQSSPANANANAAARSATRVINATVSESTAPTFFTTESSTTSPAPEKTWLDYRLSNTKKTSGQLLHDDGAILLENALIETGKPLGFAIPEKLRSVGDPGSYIVQSRGPVDAAFRAALADAGATIVSYIPNNAFLVRADAAAAKSLSSNPETLSVLAYEPVYKLKSELLPLALEQKLLPADTKLNLLVFSDAYADVVAKLKAMGWNTLAEDSSPFGRVITVNPGVDWTAIALLPGVQLLETATARVKANDLSRVRLGVASDSVVGTNYLGLTGTNILVGINDSGVDWLHPDLTNRVFANNTNYFLDTIGHGTHVAGIIAGSGAVSATVTNARGSINVSSNGHFRGMAPGSRLFVQNIGSGLGTLPDSTLQETTALTNALISNNSWTYVGSSSYSLAAASYDAAVRDSLPGRTGSQPVLYVFAAGNSGAGSDSGLNGNPGSLTSPGTSKNVLTVGAIELARDITNIVTKISVNGTNQTTNTSTPWKNMTSSGNQVAAFSARGNVGIGTEGDFGRFKPDVVTPGTFVISTRSQNWDTNAYYNPTNHHYSTFLNRSVFSGSVSNQPAVFLPDNAVGFSITLFANGDSPDPFPDLPIFVRRDAHPDPIGTAEIFRTNFLSVPPDIAGGPGTNVGQNWFYSVGNPTSEDVSFNVFLDVITTNDLGDYYTVLSNLNNSLTGTNQSPPHYYRYESGTSMSAAGVSGTLALMQEFFEQRLAATNSPAMMKALLINGARTVGNLYDFQVQSAINYQGWGLPKLNNSLRPGISNAFKLGPTDTSSVKLFDQSPTNALATGDSKTRLIKLDEAARTLPLRITLAWTDPPGNPVAGVKLVNDLDLVITNRDTGDVYYGNDITGGTFTFPWDTNTPPNLDSINNVENAYIAPALGSNYSVTVIGRRVNVNAVTAHTNEIVQDYALVIASGNGEVINAITMVGADLAIVSTNQPHITRVTNNTAQATFTTGFLENQRLGANTPMLVSTNGGTNQWHFFVMTNTTAFTNATFLVTLQTDISTPRIGVFAEDTDNSTRLSADIDMYVSLNPAITDLDPAVIAASFKSQSRNDLSGDEFLIFTNSAQNDVYYIGVKAEDQMAAQFDFFGIFSLLPLGAEDPNGFVQAYPINGYEIPDGSSSKPGGTRWLALTRPSLNTGGNAETVRGVFVTNNVTHERFGDLIGTLDHNRQAAILNNHRTIVSPPLPAAPGPYELLYGDAEVTGFTDNSGNYHDFTGFMIPPDGPGTFESFEGLAPGGTWYFTFSDDALTQTGRVNEVKLKVERQVEGDGSSTNTVAPNSWWRTTRYVPVEATNFTVCISNLTGAAPLQLYIRKDQRPTLTKYDYTMTISPSGCLSIDKFDLPPLNAGRYYIGVYNGNPSAQTFIYSSTVQLGEPPTPIPFNSIGGQPLLDDAVTDFTTFVSDDLKIQQLDVGLRIDHPRVSDLAVTLISPKGTRVLLVENRGGLDTNGFGSSLTVTNFFPVDADGTALPHTNIIDTGSTAGTITIDYEFFTQPDQMSVFYDSILIGGTAETGGSGRLVLNYGPGPTTQIQIVMNQNRTNTTVTRWEYTASSYNTANSYLIFTENTNKTTTPVKFALPPFAGTFGSSSNISEFELPTIATNYVSPQTPDGWTVLPTNIVTVITNSANLGTNSLALRSGAIRRTLVTVPGQTYRLGFAYRKAQSGDDIVSWWPGESSPADIVSTNNGTLQGGAGYAPGKVGQAFTLNGIDGTVRVPASADLNVGAGNGFAIEGWINPSNVSGLQPIVEWNSTTGGNPYAHGTHFWISVPAPAGAGPGCLYANLEDTTGAFHYFTSAPGIVVNNVFQHVALTYDKTTGIAKMYLNGAVVALENLGIFTPDTSTELFLGHRPSPAIVWFAGIIDEMTIYRRVLQDAEIQAIHAAGADGKCGMVMPPNVCSPLGAQIFVAGLATNTFLGTTNWQQGGLIFTATDTNTVVNLAPLNTNSPSGVWVDSFVLYENSGPRYVLPEESLDVLLGENAYGTWKLEIWDSRTGATNTATTLVDWQLQFVFQTNTPPPIILPPGEPQTNDVPAGSMVFMTVDVPAWATMATNTLLFATGPVDVLFNQTNPPTGADYLMLTGVADVEVLYTNGVPPLLPGQRYYLGITNSSTSNITFSIVVDYDMTELTNNSPVVTAHAPGSLQRYFFFDVSTNALAVAFRMFNMDGDMNLVARRGTPLPTLVDFDYGSFNVSSNNEDIVVFTNSAPVPLAAGRWFLGVYNNDVTNVNYTIVAREFTNLPPAIITLTNGIAYANTNSVVGQTNDFYRYVVSGNAVGVRFEITNASANVMLVARKGFPPPDAGFSDYSSNNPGLADETIVIFTNTAPVNLTPGDWFITAINVSGGAATYSIKATEYGPVTPLFNGFTYAAFNDNTKFNTDWYRYDVTTNAVRVHFELLNPSGDMTLALRRGPLPPLADVLVNDYISANGGTSNEFIVVLTNSTPVALAAGDWYLSAINISGAPTTYSVRVTEFGPDTIVTLTNAIAYMKTNTGAGSSTDYYRYVVTTNAVRAQFEIFSANADMTLVARKGLPLPGLGLFDYISAAPGTNDEFITLFTNSAPVVLSPGDWYLAAINLSGGAASYSIMATEWATNGRPIIITDQFLTTNSFCITWTSLPGVRYHVEGRTVLDSPAWTTVSPTIIATNYSTTWCIALPSPYHFFRVAEEVDGNTVILSGLPAFPGAEGAGMFAIGGRGGDVYHVTNLNDDGPGSLRFGLRSFNRTIVFDISGTIDLNSDLNINRAFITVAGQTAPGDGIALRGRSVSVQGDNIVIRHLRFRSGDLNCPVFQGDSLNFDGASNSILDHVSSSWSIDETLSATDATNVTVQWSLIAESLNNACHIEGAHGYGSLMRYGFGHLSFHHNLYSANDSRNPRLGDNLTLDFVNNVIYNWGDRAGYSGDDLADNPGGYTNRMNYVGNYLIAGINTLSPDTAFTGGETNTWIYQSGNRIDNNLNLSVDGVDTGTNMFVQPFTLSPSPFAVQPVLVDPANIAYERVLAFAGASAARDTVDLRLIGDVRGQTGQIIDSTAAVGGWPVLTSTPAPVDTDQDGMPDFWETTLGLNPTVAGNNNDRDLDGYTDLEEYLNWLATAHATCFTNTSVDIDLRPMVGVTGNFSFSVANGTNGSVILLGDGHTARFIPATAPFAGLASFRFGFTDLATGISVSPVTVSVLVNAVVPPPATPATITSAVVSTNGLTLGWTSDAGRQFSAQWTTNLAPPIVWTSFTNIIGSAGTNYTFLDDGSQTGGFGPMRFYRLLNYP